VDQVLFWEICRSHPGKIVVSLDITEDQELVTQGWTEGTGMYLEETLIELSSAGAAGYMITEVGRDALTDAPNVDALRTATSIVDEEVIAAGGVRDLDDLRELLSIGVGGVVVGREVTAGRFTVEEARDMLQGAAKARGPWSREELTVAAADYRAVLDKAGDSAAGASREVLDGFVRWLGGGAP
jgi:phosphoribosylformimino-5-aminoimidazole carboxamide ribonucleotide (ProFAR) isomerase